MSSSADRIKTIRSVVTALRRLGRKGQPDKLHRDPDILHREQGSNIFDGILKIDQGRSLCVKPQGCLRVDSLKSEIPKPKSLISVPYSKSVRTAMYTNAGGHTPSRFSDYSLVKEQISQIIAANEFAAIFRAHKKLLELQRGGRCYRLFSRCQSVS
jgi:hypothetical protein